MMSVKSMLFSRMMSRYVSTSARATKSTKCSEDVCLAAQMVSQRENTSSYTISAGRKGQPRSDKLLFFFLHSSKIAAAASRATSFEVQQEPAIAEVEVSVVSVLLHQLKQLRVQNLRVWRQKNLIRTHALRDTNAKTKNQYAFAHFTWMSERIFAKCESMAPPWGKFWFILFISSVKQLNAITSEEHTQRHTHPLKVPLHPYHTCTPHMHQ